MTKILKRPLSILLAALMIASVFAALPLTAYATSTTVTITQSDFVWGDSFTKNGVTVSAELIDPEDGNLLGGGSFSTTLGNFTKIEVTSRSVYCSGTGWSGSTWTGNASNVSFSGDIIGRGMGTTIVFTIATPGYTVTWKNSDEVLETDTDVAEGTTPTYDGAEPTKADDETYTYTFSGWSDGTNTYGASDTLPSVSANVTYTATFTATPKAAETVKTIAYGETYYIGDSIAFSDAPPFVYVRYDDDISYGPTGAYTYLVGGENTTVTAPTYSTRDGQWKFNDVLRLDPWASARPLRITGTKDRTPIGFKCSGGTGTSSDPFTFECVFEAEEETVINYDGEHTLNPSDKVTVSGEDAGKSKFGLNLDEYFNMQMLGIQKKSAIATQGGDDGIRFVTAVNTNLLKGEKIEDYGYIVVKAKDGTSVDKIYENMDKLTYDKVGANNRFTCKGTSNTISGDFGKYDTNTDYKYVTLSLTGTSGSPDTIAARFYVKTTDGNYYYADYIDGNNVTHRGMAFTLPIA